MIAPILLLTVLANFSVDPHLSIQKDADKKRTDLMALAKMGRPDALNIVRAALHRGRTVPKLTDRTKLPKVTKDPEVILSNTINSKGVKWALIKWNALGGSEDLWVVRRNGNRWIDPIYTGLNTYWPHSQLGEPVQEGYAKHQKEMNALIAKKGWVKRFVNNPAASLDSDKDEYTDIVERTLGLNPKGFDSDGDGIPDGIDKNPFAKPGPLNDTEAAMQAAMSMFLVEYDSTSSNIIIHFPSQNKIFEIESCRGMVLPADQPKGFPPRGENTISGNWFTIRPTVKPLSKDGSLVEITIQESGGFYEKTWGAKVQK
ncbi:MAG: hypothetical protein WCG75_09880, partial [Armatimonadota bacterium]